MKTQKHKTMTLLIFFAFLVMTSMNAYAADGVIKFSNNAFKQVISKAADGSVQYDYVEPKQVLPKDVILYEIVFENISNENVTDIVINNPIANNSKYRGNSADGKSTEITFSVDSKNFAAANSLTVKDESGKSWQAKPENYTAIRWVYKEVLKPGEKSKVTYKTSIK